MQNVLVKAVGRGVLRTWAQATVVSHGAGRRGCSAHLSKMSVCANLVYHILDQDQLFHYEFRAVWRSCCLTSLGSLGVVSNVWDFIDVAHFSLRSRGILLVSCVCLLMDGPRD